MKDTDYTFGTQQESAAALEKRRQYRLTARARITLELEANDPGFAQQPGSSGRELVCGIRDISASGLCVISEECLPEGALFPASVSLGSHLEPFLLTVEIVWCQQNEAGYLVGVRIIESDQTAYVEWTEAVASALDAS
ncbi:hypothetical protein GCM10011533_26540 [Streptosporangium jomthongense]|uniref:PilZ domain-containing protein n=1 Tax=Marinobacter aromaticivorans TaxID=1494078 RepID=A0ABW2IWR4_9GAMM|nr:PilZ domain-containing protein [Marinobacter aromaticivorans]GGE72841.1 hypothetical protein GCM10011533_26540 [Streptosporangium jomthongense]